MTGTLTVVGLQGGEWFGRAADAALTTADVVIGADRHLDALGGDRDGRLTYRSFGELLDLVDEHLRRDEAIAVLASGDPGFFGAVRALASRCGPALVAVHPAPSSVALAAGRAGISWDDAKVISAHGRALDAGLPVLLTAPKAAVLTSPDTPPEAVGAALARSGQDRRIWVASRLGEDDESVTETDVAGLAGERWDPLSVVLVVSDVPSGPGVTWGVGRPVGSFAHRGGMITKPEVRAIVLAHLDLDPAATVWDVGAGSGSVGIEATRMAPGLRVWAVERRPDDVARIEANAAGLPVTVVTGEAPDALGDLPDPDRAFVGGGGPAVLEAVMSRVPSSGRVVATFAALDRALAAGQRLGNLVQVAVSRAVPIGAAGALRLDADNPVWVAWGPGARP